MLLSWWHHVTYKSIEPNLIKEIMDDLEKASNEKDVLEEEEHPMVCAGGEVQAVCYAHPVCHAGYGVSNQEMHWSSPCFVYICLSTQKYLHE